MSEGLTESVKQALEERIKNPLWGFIILSWIWFNWPNLAMLFMSDAPVKFRIDYILSQDYFYLHYIVAPVFAGGILAVVSPYAQWVLSKAHKWANDKSRDNVYQSKRQDFVDAIKLSKLKVQSDRAVETENAKIDADIKAEVERGKREELVTQELESQKRVLEENIESLNDEIERNSNFLKEILNEKQNYKNFLADFWGVISNADEIKDKESVEKLKSDIRQLIKLNGDHFVELRDFVEKSDRKFFRKKVTVSEFVEKMKKLRERNPEVFGKNSLSKE